VPPRSDSSYKYPHPPSPKGRQSLAPLSDLAHACLPLSRPSNRLRPCVTVLSPRDPCVFSSLFSLSQSDSCYSFRLHLRSHRAIRHSFSHPFAVVYECATSEDFSFSVVGPAVYITPRLRVLWSVTFGFISIHPFYFELTRGLLICVRHGDAPWMRTLIRPHRRLYRPRACAHVNWTRAVPGPCSLRPACTVASETSTFDHVTRACHWHPSSLCMPCLLIAFIHPD